MTHHRQLGKNGPPVSAIGYGAMVLEGYYGAIDEVDALAVLRHALDTGIAFIDTADAYGNGHNDHSRNWPWPGCCTRARESSPFRAPGERRG